MVKKILKNTVAAVIFLPIAAFGFDWPQNEIMSDSFYSYFGQLRGGTISTSLVFSESEEVKAADSGRIIAVITEHDEDDLFESTLGNAVILAHKDNLTTVYANLDAENQENLFNMKDIEIGTKLGNTSNSGWQTGEACLEFQVLDIKNENYVNPRILMPRIGNELDLNIKNISAMNKKGEIFDFSITKNIPSGTYLLYRARQKTAMPYKTAVYVNGAAADSIAYDTLIAKDGKICANGKHPYSIETVYPDSEKQLLGEITIPKGKNTISAVVQDILGKEKQITYTIEAR